MDYSDFLLVWLRRQASRHPGFASSAFVHHLTKNSLSVRLCHYYLYYYSTIYTTSGICYVLPAFSGNLKESSPGNLCAIQLLELSGYLAILARKISGVQSNIAYIAKPLCMSYQMLRSVIIFKYIIFVAFLFNPHTEEMKRYIIHTGIVYTCSSTVYKYIFKNIFYKRREAFVDDFMIKAIHIKHDVVY